MYRTFIGIMLGMISCTVSYAQDMGILPLTGIHYYKQGVWAKSVDVKIDNMFLISNKVPYNKEVQVILQQPSGFSSDKKKISFPAVEYSLMNQKGDKIFSTPNLLLNNETTGFAAKDMKTLSFKFVLTVEMLKNNLNVTAKFRIYDLKGNNQLTLEFPISMIAKQGEVLQVSKLAGVTVKSPTNISLMASGVKIPRMYFGVDTTIKSHPATAYASFEMSGITGTSLGGIFDGKEKFWVYDDKLNEIKITDILLKEVGGAMENNDVSYTLKVPFRQKKAPPKGYIVRFRWESADKSQVIDIIAYI